MTEVSFYHLTRTEFKKALPQLLEKIIETGERAILISPSKERSQELNTILWTYSTLKFLPHGIEEDGFSDEQPIYLTEKEENPNGASFLVTLDGVEPEFLPKFNRMIDMFDGNDEEQVARARKRWASYKEQGHTLTYWKQNEKGKWEKNSD